MCTTFVGMTAFFIHLSAVQRYPYRLPYYYFYRSEHSASRKAVAACTIVLHFSLSWAVFVASVIGSQSLSFIVLVNLVSCRPLDRFPNTIPVNKSFSMHLCLIMCRMNWRFCCSIWYRLPSVSANTPEIIFSSKGACISM